MENATKALLMGAGVLFAMMILSLLVYAYSVFSGSQQLKVDSTTAQQIAEFNEEYTTYNRDDVTGIELYSLLKKIEDYNARIADDTTLVSGANSISTNIEELLRAEGYDGTVESLSSEVKGAYYRCTGIEYNSTTGRISSINFEKR